MFGEVQKRANIVDFEKCNAAYFIKVYFTHRLRWGRERAQTSLLHEYVSIISLSDDKGGEASGQSESRLMKMYTMWIPNNPASNFLRLPGNPINNDGNFISPLSWH